MPDDHAELPPVDRATFAGRYGPCALVAGGASGLGAEYCRQIAATGIDLVILDHDESALGRDRERAAIGSGRGGGRDCRRRPRSAARASARRGATRRWRPRDRFARHERSVVGDRPVPRREPRVPARRDRHQLPGACRARPRARRSHGRERTRRNHCHVVTRGRDRRREHRAVLGDQGVRPRVRRRPVVRAA